MYNNYRQHLLSSASWNSFYDNPGSLPRAVFVICCRGTSDRQVVVILGDAAGGTERFFFCAVGSPRAVHPSGVALPVPCDQAVPRLDNVWAAAG
jgi:hypothetical protein